MSCSVPAGSGDSNAFTLRYNSISASLLGPGCGVLDA